jgi:hypothetical protein
VTSLIMLQNLIADDGRQLVIEWPMGVYERYCTNVPDGTEPGAEIVMVDRLACGWHYPTAREGEECVLAARTPPECQHPERADMTCTMCGLVGADVTDIWVKPSLGARPPEPVPVPPAEDTEITTAPESAP